MLEQSFHDALRDYDENTIRSLELAGFNAQEAYEAAQASDALAMHHGLHGRPAPMPGFFFLIGLLTGANYERRVQELARGEGEADA
jgi:hypothetical protein